MPKERRKLHFKRNPIYYAYLLVIFGLIKIGSGPLLITHYLYTSLRGAKRRSNLIFKGRRLPIQIRLPRHIPYGIWLAMTIVFFTYTLLLIHLSGILPSPTKLSENTRPLTTEIYDRSGNLLYRFYEGQNRSLIKLSDLPPQLIQATIAAEDKNFYKHIGIDLGAILRAIHYNLNNDDLQGASTITQQLVKNTLLVPEKTISRKLKEVFLAIWTETIYSKDQILEMYFNEAPYGGPAWGVEAASLMYFGKSAKYLNLAESSYLAGLPASPTQFSPYGTNPELTKIRQKQVLNQMVLQKYITQGQSDEAFAQKLDLQSPTNTISAPHFVWFVKDYLSFNYGSNRILQGGLKITTTLDLGLHKQVEEIVKKEVEGLKNLNVKNGAAMVVDAKTGQILSMVGSKNYYEEGFGNFNATLALRQPGSSIKVVTYAEAFKKGFSPGNTILDIPVSFPDGEKKYSPVNYDGRFHGPVSIRVALGSSYNIPAVKMLAIVGIDNMIKTARDLGITTFVDPVNYGLSLTLGGGEVKMIDMMSVYSTLSQSGVKRPVTPILKVEDSSGIILESFEDKSKEVIQPEIAYLLNDILSDDLARARAFGTHSLLYIPNQKVAVKTGTSDNKRDNWTFGYTPEYVVGVWVGNNDNSPMNPTLTSGVTGAAPIWNKIMTYILKNRQPIAFEKPEGVIDSIVDGRRDLAISGNVPKGLVKIQKDEDKLIFADQFSSFATTSASLLGVSN